MPGNSPMVSLRIPEDHLLELDRLVGFDGMRNRSDVIREAVKRMLSTHLPAAFDLAVAAMVLSVLSLDREIELRIDPRGGGAIKSPFFSEVEPPASA